MEKPKTEERCSAPVWHDIIAQTLVSEHQLLRAGCASNSKFIWTPEMNLEFEKVKVISLIR